MYMCTCVVFFCGAWIAVVSRSILFCACEKTSNLWLKLSPIRSVYTEISLNKHSFSCCYSLSPRTRASITLPSNWLSIQFCHRVTCYLYSWYQKEDPSIGAPCWLFPTAIACRWASLSGYQSVHCWWNIQSSRVDTQWSRSHCPATESREFPHVTQWHHHSWTWYECGSAKFATRIQSHSNHDVRYGSHEHPKSKWFKLQERFSKCFGLWYAHPLWVVCSLFLLLL